MVKAEHYPCPATVSVSRIVGQYFCKPPRFSSSNPFLKNINIKLFHDSQYDTQTLHKSVHSNPQHPVSSSSVFRSQYSLFLARYVCYICCRWYNRKRSSNQRGELLVDLQSLHGRRSKSLGGKRKVNDSSSMASQLVSHVLF